VLEEAMRFVTESGVVFWEAELRRPKGTRHVPHVLTGYRG
jgi:hypothetical protein